MSLTATGRNRIESLDSCRGIAILIVIAFHVSVPYKPAAWLGQVATLGNLGVQLFFLVSAVTMCMMWNQRKNEARRTLKFYIRRYLRIAPLFWFAIGLYTFAWHMWPDIDVLREFSWRQIAVTALFVHTFFPDAINWVVPGGWSIGIEMGFYAVFPLLALMPKDRLPLIAFVAYIILGIIATAIAEHFGIGENYPGFLYYSFLTQLPIFPIGMFVYSITHREVTFSARSIGMWVALWLCIAALTKFAFQWDSRPLFWLEVMVLAAAVGSSIRWNLATKWLAYVGRLSYSMYLFHFAVLHFFLERNFGDHWPYFIGLAATLAITIAIAAASQATAERWSQEFARYLVNTLADKSASTAKA